MNAFDEQSRSLWMDTVVADAPELADNRRADTVLSVPVLPGFLPHTSWRAGARRSLFSIGAGSPAG
jgi:hypothetical protein